MTIDTNKIVLLLLIENVSSLRNFYPLIFYMSRFGVLMVSKEVDVLVELGYLIRNEDNSSYAITERGVLFLDSVDFDIVKNLFNGDKYFLLQNSISKRINSRVK